jgi:hypothetical protein
MQPAAGHKHARSHWKKGLREYLQIITRYEASPSVLKNTKVIAMDGCTTVMHCHQSGPELYRARWAFVTLLFDGIAHMQWRSQASPSDRCMRPVMEGPRLQLRQSLSTVPRNRCM